MMRPAPLLALIYLSAASPAFAHAVLERAVPAAGSELHQTPRQIVLTFSEAVEPSFSNIELRDARGTAIAAPAAYAGPDNRRRLVIDLPPLSPGRYSVVWHVTSVDTHKTEGSFQFTVMLEK
jgi:hypothetical protein